jgi:membrane protein
MFPRASLSDCKRAFDRWNDHNGGRLGAALAFYTLLSLAPLLIFIVAIVGFVFGKAQAQDWILQQATNLVGGQGATAIHNMLVHHAHAKPSEGIAASIIGVVTLLFGASGVFVELRNGLDTVWDLHAPSAASIKGFARTRLFSFGMVLAIGFLLLVSLIVSTVLAAIVRYFSQYIPFPPWLLEVLNIVVSVYVIAGMFALIFKYVPETSLPWRQAWAGALFTSVFFTVGKVLLGLYLGIAGVGSAYGAAGSLVAVVVWVYYSAQIFYYGAEMTWVRASKELPAGPDASKPVSPNQQNIMARPARA